MIDLHVHSTFSDGSFTPEELVAKAAGIELTAMALTDHDSTAGLPRFLNACRETSVRGIPGVEISADVPKGTMHILGYHIDPTNEALVTLLAKIQSGRDDRNHEILDKLRVHGMDLPWDNVLSYAGEDVVGRPHIAQAMVELGMVASTREAFDRYLAKGKVAYVERFRLTPEESIGIIRGAGGVVALAHPFTLGLSPEALKQNVKAWVDVGLQAIEVYYSEHNAGLVQEYLSLTERFDLVAVGGSDFHGAINPGIHLGVGFGPLRVPDQVLEHLDQKKAESNL